MLVKKNVRKSLAAIGVTFAEKLNSADQDAADIELALLQAAFEINSGRDPKILAPLLSWIQIHGERVNMERLRKLKTKLENNNDHCWISLFAFFGLHCKQSRWKILALKTSTPKATVDVELAQLQIRHKGLETWAEGTGFLIPANSEPISPKYALSPNQLAQVCRQYRNRLIFGTSWRADIVTAFENGAKTALEASRNCGSAYEPAQRIYAELKLAGYFAKV